MISTIVLWFTTSKVGRYVALLGGTLLGILALIKFGESRQRQKDKVKGYEDYKETRERIDSVTRNTNRDDALERLRRNGHIRD